MNSILNPENSNFIDSIMKSILQQQLQHQKNGDYVEAEKCRQKLEQTCKSSEKKKIYQMQQKHKEQNANIQKAHLDQLSHFNKFWDQKISNIRSEGDKLQKQMEQKHKSDQKKTREELEATLSCKVKESSQLLNLRKMEEHMVKQKNYPEAHKVQAKVQKMEKEEKGAWLEMRNNKIQTALSTLRIKQAAELMTLKKRITASIQQNTRQKKIEQDKLKHKYQNICVELKSQHEKEILLFKGQYTSLGGTNEPIPKRTLMKKL